MRVSRWKFLFLIQDKRFKRAPSTVELLDLLAAQKRVIEFRVLLQRFKVSKTNIFALFFIYIFLQAGWSVLLLYNYYFKAVTRLNESINR